MMKRMAGAALLPVMLVAGCSSGPEFITFDKPLPTCADFAATVTGLGMPNATPQPRPSSSPSVREFDCSYESPQKHDPPLLVVATIAALRPNYKQSEKDPRKRFGGLYADVNCAGDAGPNPALPEGTSCYEVVGEGTAQVAVSGATEQSGVRASLIWTDRTARPKDLRSDALAKANALAAAVIAKL